MYDYTKDDTTTYTIEDQRLRIVIELKGNAMQFPTRDEVEDSVNSLMRGIYGESGSIGEYTQ